MSRFPLLSLCIPTYNRGAIVCENVERLLALPSFDDEVELVISDNASTDNTQTAVEALCRKYPDKQIRYSRNAENIRDRNFFKAMSLGHGEYLKLLNDYTSFSDDDLRLMKSEIMIHRGDDDVCLFFFENIKGAGPGEKVYIADVDGFVRTLNNKMTWISNFGCFKRQLGGLGSFQEKSGMMILQMMWLLYLVSCSKSVVLVNITSYSCIRIANEKRTPYNFFTPHVVNYYVVLDEYVQRGLVSRSTIRFDKTRLLKDFVGNGIKDYLFKGKPNNFDMSGSWGIIWRHFYAVPYFYVILLKGSFHAAKRFVISFSRHIF